MDDSLIQVELLEEQSVDSKCIAPVTVDRESRGVFLMVVLFTGGAIYHAIFQFDFVSAGFCCLMAMTLFWIFVFSEKNYDRIDEFERWLIENDHALRNGTARFDGQQLDYESQVTQYRTLVSLIVFSFTLPSKYFVVGHSSGFAKGLPHSIGTALFGIWSIPEGPILTIKEIIQNATGGNKIHIGDLLDEIERRVNEKRGSE